MKIPIPSRRAAGLAVAIVLILASIVWRVSRPAPTPHVQIVLASDGAVMIAGVPGRSMRSQIQNPTFWNGKDATSPRLVDFLKIAKFLEQQHKTYDGRAGVIVDDHASFEIARMLLESTRTSYPDVYFVHGQVAELPARGGGADKPRPVESYVKDCSTNPPPPGCAKN